METTVVSTIWQKSKLVIKALIISAVVLLLMIPTYFVQQIIDERKTRQEEAFLEVSSKWAGPQTVTGPMVVIPYTEAAVDNVGREVSVRHQAYLLPDKLLVNGEVIPETRKRGIYEVMLYTTQMNIDGSFGALPVGQLKIDPSRILWNEAYVVIGLGDAKGLREEIRLQWNDSTLALSPAKLSNGVINEGFMAPVVTDGSSPIRFSSTISLNGSGKLTFTPVGRETTINLSSTWPDPSFIGSQLPTHNITDKGFKATWRSLAHTRAFPQAWKDASYNLSEAAVGADLLIPVNGYQKTTRSIKYAILCILLTFAAFFIMETVNKRSVHPFQYALIGLALVLFYTLLLSFSEYTGFNTAYIIASVATVGLVGWYVRGIFQSGRLSVFLSLLLILMYSYLFTILQLQDYSLLLGSIGLFVTLGVMMKFTRKIQW